MTEVNDAEMHQLGLVHTHTQQVAEACQALCQLFERQNTPAIPDTIALTEDLPTRRLEEGVRSLSVAIYNPSPAIVYMGYAGGKPTADARAWSVPPASALVLPVSGEDFEFGTDAAALADGDVVFFVLRYVSVQPFFFGALGG